MISAQSQRIDASTIFASFGLSFSTFAVSEPKSQQRALFGLINPCWELIQFLPITVEKDQDGDYFVSDDIFLVYGTGETLEQARQDYVTSLIEYYQILSEQQDQPTRALFQHLQSFLRPVQG